MTAAGDVLRPMLVLKRKTPYFLRADNKINLMVANSSDGWVNEDIIVQWLQSVLLPYVKNNVCLLLWDSYEAHISKKVISFLKDYPNINVGIVIGGTTDQSQPLDLGINRRFKAACRRKALAYTNALLEVRIDNASPEQTKVSDKLLIGNNLVITN